MYGVGMGPDGHGGGIHGVGIGPAGLWGWNNITTLTSATGVAAVARCPVGLAVGVALGLAYGIGLAYRLVPTIPCQSPRFGPGV